MFKTLKKLVFLQRNDEKVGDAPSPDDIKPGEVLVRAPHFVHNSYKLLHFHFI